MEFKTFEVEEFYAMIAFAVREGLTFEANNSGDQARRVYIIGFTGGY
tara:strand:- start:228 stop:368 length:141 start_codon:yes stop_codon:yes gene_type:complete